MKKLLPISLVILIALTFSTAAFAQDTLLTTATGAATTTTQSDRLDQKRDAAIKKLEERRAALDQKVENREAKIATRTAQLKAKLQAFKNQKKAEIAERVSTNLNRVNTNRTMEMKLHLQKMSDLLTKVETKNQDASASALVAKAKTAIATAEAAVTAQSQKDYTVQATTEGRIKTDVKTTRDQLFKDLTETRKLVIQARQSLVEAVMVVVRKGATNGQ